MAYVLRQGLSTTRCQDEEALRRALYFYGLTSPAADDLPIEEVIDQVLEVNGGEVTITPLEDHKVTTYKIVRHWFGNTDSRTIKTGLSLEEAQTHCRREDTHGPGWFDGYAEEK